MYPYAGNSLLQWRVCCVTDVRWDLNSSDPGQIVGNIILNLGYFKFIFKFQGQGSQVGSRMKHNIANLFMQNSHQSLEEEWNIYLKFDRSEPLYGLLVGQGNLWGPSHGSEVKNMRECQSPFLLWASVGLLGQKETFYKRKVIFYIAQSGSHTDVDGHTTVFDHLLAQTRMDIPSRTATVRHTNALYDHCLWNTGRQWNWKYWKQDSNPAHNHVSKFSAFLVEIFCALWLWIFWFYVKAHYLHNLLSTDLWYVQLNPVFMPCLCHGYYVYAD